MSSTDKPAPSIHVALVTGSLGEGAGGLASAVRALAYGLAGAGVRVSLFSLDLATVFGPANLPSHRLIKNFVVPCVFVPYLRLTWAPQLRSRLSHYCHEQNVDLIHCNGVWLAGTRITRQVARNLGIPYLVSPHGHLQPWAMGNKPWKKKLAWRMYGKRCVNDAALIHAASELERDGACNLGINRPTATIPNIVQYPDHWPEPASDSDTRRTCLYLSRIHPSKGLLDLVAAWKNVRPPGWRVLIAGPDEGGHLSQVESAVACAGLQSDFQFIGAVPYAERWRWYRRADLYVLPTYSENFGIGVAEALGAGTPAITTHAAPWRMLERANCGWWIAPGPEALMQALKQACTCSDVERKAMGERGQSQVQERFAPPMVSRSMLDVYIWILRAGPRPGCVTLPTNPPDAA